MNSVPTGGDLRPTGKNLKQIPHAIMIQYRPRLGTADSRGCDYLSSRVPADYNSGKHRDLLQRTFISLLGAYLLDSVHWTQYLWMCLDTQFSIWQL